MQTNIFTFAKSMEKCDSKYCACLYYSAGALSRIMTKMAEEEFAVTGFSPSHAFLLMSVNEKPGIRPKEICKHIQLMPSTVTRLIEKLEQKGFVKRESVGKSTEVYPTKKSTQIDSKIKEAWLNLYKRYSELIGEKEGKELTTLINNAISNLSD